MLLLKVFLGIFQTNHLLHNLLSFELLEKESERAFNTKIIALRSNIGASPTEFYSENLEYIPYSGIVFPVHVFGSSIVYSRGI